MDELHALLEAKRVAGSQAKLAQLCRKPNGRPVSQPAVWGWIHKLRRLPADYVLDVEAGTGVSRHALRPDIYPQERTHA